MAVSLAVQKQLFLPEPIRAMVLKPLAAQAHWPVPVRMLLLQVLKPQQPAAPEAPQMPASAWPPVYPAA